MLRYRTGVALIVVDVQNDFADPGGSLSVTGGADVVPRDQPRGDRWPRTTAALVVYTQDWHPEHTPHFAKDGGIWPDHCVADTWGAAFHPALEVPAGPRSSARAPTARTATPASRCATRPRARRSRPSSTASCAAAGVDAVVVTGLATDYCVKATALDAVRLGFATTVLTDAIAAVDLQPGDGERSLAELEDAGVLLQSTRLR